MPGPSPQPRKGMPSPKLDEREFRRRWLQQFVDPACAVVAHGCVEGAEGVRRHLADWLGALGLVSAGARAEIDRYIGYWQPYATSHLALDGDRAIQVEVRNAARLLAAAVADWRAGRTPAAPDLPPPRDK